MVLEISAVKVEELCGANSQFPSFSEKYSRAISVCDVTDDLCSEHEADLHTEHKDPVSLEPDSKRVNFEDFYGIFRSLPCGTQGIKITG